VTAPAGGADRGPYPQHLKSWFDVNVAAVVGKDAVFDIETRRSAARMRRTGPAEAASLTTIYTTEAAPPAADADDAEALAAALRTRRPRIGAVRFDALRAPDAAVLEAGFARDGWAVEAFDHFGTWFAPVAGAGFDAYLNARPGALRSTIARKTKRAARDGFAAVRMRGAAERDAAIAAYAAAASAAWQGSELHPEFMPRLVAAGTAEGWCEAFALKRGEDVAAAQVWLVGGRRATLFKLAFDPRFAGLSPGTVLTAAAIEALIGDGGLDEIDFGRGDDDYKQNWAPERRQMRGVAAFDPRTLRGLVSSVGVVARRAGRRILRR